MLVETAIYAQWATLNSNSPPPLENRIWTEDPFNIMHDGLNVSQWFRETPGRAIVNGRILTYFLYDTYYKNNGSGIELFQAFFDYVENDGWIINYENIQFVDPNPNLAESVKAMMRSRDCDVSFTLIQDEMGAPDHVWAYCVVNNFNKTTGVYSTVIFYINRYYDRNGNMIR